MRTRISVLFTTLILLLGAACFRMDATDMQLTVDGITSERDIVLITNAAQRELMGELPEIKHECHVDLPQSTISYFEGPRIMDSSYQRRILSALENAGYSATIKQVSHNPTAPMRVVNHHLPIVVWPDRCKMVVVIPSMTTVLDANRVADALSFARLGERPLNLSVDPITGIVRIHHQERRFTARGNYAHAITTAGYRVNGWPEITSGDAVPARGWLPAEG
jgi:hypothetical protein